MKGGVLMKGGGLHRGEDITIHNMLYDWHFNTTPGQRWWSTAKGAAAQVADRSLSMSGSLETDQQRRACVITLALTSLVAPIGVP